MGNLTTHSNEFELTNEQIELVRKTIAPNATENEFKLFIYRCQSMRLDPLKPGHIHFVKYGNNPGTIVIGIEGFRSKAAQTGKHHGTKRGVLRDSRGNCIGAYCDVYRQGWTEPAHEEVSLREYSTGKAMWLKMPETMIKKVAEVAALRMAFPDELGGLYSDDEMEQAAKDVTPPVAPVVEPPKPVSNAAIIKFHDTITKPPPKSPARIKQLMIEKNVAPEDMKRYANIVYGVESSTDLSEQQMRDVIIMLETQTEHEIKAMIDATCESIDAFLNIPTPNAEDPL